MRITAKTSFSGVDFSAGIGDVIDVPDEIAHDLIQAGYAEAEQEKPDTAAGKAAKRTRK